MRVTLAGIVLSVLPGWVGCANVEKSTDSKRFQEKIAEEFLYVNLPVVQQERRATCGAAVLAAVGQFWNVPITEAGIWQDHAPLDPDGYRLKELAVAAEAEGLQAFMVSGRDDPQGFLQTQLRRGRPVLVAVMLPQTGDYFERNVPVIESFAWSTALPGTAGGQQQMVRQHFLAVMGFAESGEERVLLMDPEVGIVPLPWSQFKGYWERMGYAALLVGK